MNRIAQIREAAGLSQAQLAERVGTSQETISRLETGRRKLTHDWMRAIANALDVAPANLITSPQIGDFREDAVPYVAQGVDARLMSALRRANRDLWTITTDALENIGIKPGDVVEFDISSEAVAAVRTGDVVIAQLYDRDDVLKAKTVIRQFIAPGLLTTNRRATNIAVTMDNENFDARIKGVRVVPDGPAQQ